MRLIKKISFSIALILFVAQISIGQTSSAGQFLSQQLDAMDVEHHWLAGEHIRWNSGLPDGKPVSGNGLHTHCSAFVAAACRHFSIYILRPPEHGQDFLANAQCRWLAGEGKSKGWQQVEDGVAAQRLANQGMIVVACYQTGDDKKPGHIAIVRPMDKSVGQINQEGPQIIQAGKHNYRSIPLKEGFKNHPGAFDHASILFYYHPVE